MRNEPMPRATAIEPCDCPDCSARPRSAAWDVLAGIALAVSLIEIASALTGIRGIAVIFGAL